MNKKQLIDAIADKQQCTKTEALEFIDHFAQIATNELKANGDFNFFGIGSFKVKFRPERQGRNPSNGEAITIAAKNAVSFKGSKILLDQLNS